MTASRTAISSILALDTAGAACSAALWRGGRVVASRFEPMRRGHAERLVPMIEAVMAEASLTYGELDLLAVTLGPGAFTGVRIGLATARGLALASGRPLVGVSSFLVLAATARAEAPPGGSLAVAIDAKRDDLYLQAFAPDLKPRTGPLSVRPDDLVRVLPPGPLVLVGDGVAQAAPHLEAARRPFTRSATPGLVDAARLAELVASEDHVAGDGEAVEPLYLRQPDAIPLAGGSAGRP
jgi:tRNA threonylcarbamoyladenosine biosynthesis protein TsaB